MKEKIRSYLLRKLVTVTLPEDIFIIKNYSILLGGQKIGDNELQQLQAEIKALEGFKIWHVMNETTRNMAIRISINDATSWDQVVAGKMALYVLSVFHDVMQSIKNKR